MSVWLQTPEGPRVVLEINQNTQRCLESLQQSCVKDNQGNHFDCDWMKMIRFPRLLVIPFHSQPAPLSQRAIIPQLTRNEIRS